MPFVPNTPESKLSRSDSKNPDATCRGVTSTGRLCRRAITGTSAANPTSPLDLEGRYDIAAYCWQHKDQVDSSLGSVSPQIAQSAAVRIRERASVETLIERLGLLGVGDQQDVDQKASRHQTGHSPRVEAKHLPKDPKKPSDRRRNGASSKQTRQNHFAMFFCIGVADEDRLAARLVPKQGSNSSPVRVRRSTQQIQDTKLSVAREKPSTLTSPMPKRQRDLSNRTSPLPASQGPPQRPSLPATPSSKTAQLLSLIPHTVSPQTSAFLLAELAKPPSVSDEPGYIYMFWLTPDSLPSPPAPETASSLLSAPPVSPTGSHLRPPLDGRRTSSVLKSFSVQSASGAVPRKNKPETTNSPKTFLLKIGRASNVQRRLNQWSQQCGYNLSLLRYYPYQSTSTMPSPSSRTLRSSSTPLKVPNVHKIERLIHLELAHKRPLFQGENGDENFNKKCDRCGAAHREWFEVDASRDGVKGLDEVVRRWVDWGLQDDGRDSSV